MSIRTSCRSADSSRVEKTCQLKYHQNVRGLASSCRRATDLQAGLPDFFAVSAAQRPDLVAVQCRMAWIRSEKAMALPHF
jgi:hypothetical protein